MNKERLIELAKKAGWEYADDDRGFEPLWDFAELVRADEREACAKVCDDLYRVWTLTDEDDLNPPDALDCKRAILARGNT
jgi:hypothetical protein